MSQPRKYGVIKNNQTAVKFINDLNESIGQGIWILSEYLTEAMATAAVSALTSNGTINEVLSNDAQNVIFTDLTLNASGSSSDASGGDDACILLSNNLFLVVRPYNNSGTPVTRMFIKHTYTPDTGDPITTVMDLGQLNSDNRACALAYEITICSDGGDKDCLVKLAWCGPDTLTTERALSKIFAGLDINCYTGSFSGNTYNIYPGRTQHTDVVFGYKAPYGGFVIHKMKDPANSGSTYGITIFAEDATPLYTWAGYSKPFTIVKNGCACYANVSGNHPGLGRHICEATEDYAPIKLAVLAPIFCPSVDDYAAKAKWIQQSPHDYSYFDRSGHIKLSKAKESGTAVFVDHGVCLLDGDAEYTDHGEMIPDSSPYNLAALHRPDIPTKIAYASDFSVYLDSEAGLDATTWMSLNDYSDMTFSGSATVGTDLFTGRPYIRLPNSTAAYGYGKLDFAVDLDHDANGNDIKNGGTTSNATVLLVCGRLNVTTFDWDCQVTGISTSQPSRTCAAMFPMVGITNKTASFKEDTTSAVYTEYYSPTLFTFAGRQDNVEKTALFFSDNQTRCWNSLKTLMYDATENNYLAAGTTSMRFIAALMLERTTGGVIRRHYRYLYENGDSDSFTRDRGASGYSVAYNGSLGLNNVAFAESAGSSSVRTSRYLAEQSYWRDNTYGYNPVDTWSALSGGDKPDISIDLYFVGAGNYVTANHLDAQFRDLKEKFFPDTN